MNNFQIFHLNFDTTQPDHETCVTPEQNGSKMQHLGQCMGQAQPLGHEPTDSVAINHVHQVTDVDH